MATFLLKLLASTAYAQSSNYTLNYKFPGEEQVVSSPAQYVEIIFKFSLGIVGLVALGFIVYSGIRYILSAGNPSALSDARSQMLAAIIGVVLLLSAYIILREINPKLVELTDPELIKVTPKAKFDIEKIQKEWGVVGNNLEAIQAKINKAKKLENELYKAHLAAMSDEQRLTYFRSLDPIAQRNYIVTLAGLGVPFAGVTRQLAGDEVTRIYENLSGRSEQTAMLQRLDAPQTAYMYYYAGDPKYGGNLARQRNILAQMAETQYGALYAVFQSQDEAERAQGKEANHARDFLEQISDYHTGGLRYRIAVPIALSLPESERPQFIADLGGNFGSSVSLKLSERKRRESE